MRQHHLYLRKWSASIVFEISCCGKSSLVLSSDPLSLSLFLFVCLPLSRTDRDSSASAVASVPFNFRLARADIVRRKSYRSFRSALVSRARGYGRKVSAIAEGERGKGLRQDSASVADLFWMDERHSHGKKVSFDSSFTKEKGVRRGARSSHEESLRSLVEPCNVQFFSFSLFFFFFSFFFCSFIIIRKTRREGGKEARPLSEQPNEPAVRADGPRGVRGARCPPIGKLGRAKQTMEDEEAMRQTAPRIHLLGKGRQERHFETGKCAICVERGRPPLDASFCPFTGSPVFFSASFSWLSLAILPRDRLFRPEIFESRDRDLRDAFIRHFSSSLRYRFTLTRVIVRWKARVWQGIYIEPLVFICFRNYLDFARHSWYTTRLKIISITSIHSDLKKDWDDVYEYFFFSGYP